MCLYISINQFHGCRIHRNTAGAEYESVGDDGLGVDSWEGFWGVRGEDGGSWVRHFFVASVGGIGFVGFEFAEVGEKFKTWLWKSQSSRWWWWCFVREQFRVLT